MVSPCMVRWRADCRQSDCLPLIRRAGRRLAQRQWCVLELSFPGRPGRCRHRSKAPSYPGRRRTSQTVAFQRHEFESRCDSTLPGPSPVLGLATVVRDSPARPCSRWSRHLMLAWSRTTEMAHPFPPLIDRWMLRRSYCVCVWRLTSMCGRVSAAERLMWSIVRTAPNQSDGLRVLIV